MTVITPGVDYIVSNIGQPTIPPLVLVALAHLLSEQHGYDIPKWAVAAASALSIPLAASAKVTAARLYNKYQASKAGARLAPELHGSRIGNFDLLRHFKNKIENDYLAQGLFELHSKMGPIVNVRMGWSDLIFTTSPEYIKRILATDFDNFVKGKRFHQTFFSVLGNGVFNSDGDTWKFHRAMTRPFFNKDRISDFDIFDDHSKVAIERMKERLRTGFPVDFQDLMSCFTIDSAAAFLFGREVNSLEDGLPYPENAQVPESAKAIRDNSKANAFAKGFIQSLKLLAARERYRSIWPLYEIKADKTDEPMKDVKAYLDPIINEALEKVKAEGVKEVKADEVADGETLLDHLVASTQDPVMIRDEMLNILIAGRDTTAATLTFLFYLLSMNPSVMTRLREEVLEHVGPTSRPDYNDIKDMKYLRAVINETLRLFPAVPLNVRETVNATVWPSPDPNELPIYIPGGTKLIYSVFLMHRRKDLWGPDADEFDPDRFLDQRKKYLVKNSFIFLPFNAGPRICLGQQFAYNEMSFMIIRLLQNFSSVSLDLDAFSPDSRPKTEWKEGTTESDGRRAIEQVWPRTHVTIYAQGGMWVRMQEADD